MSVTPLEVGESCIVNRNGSAAACNASTTFSNNSAPIRTADGYADVSASSACTMSYAVLRVISAVLVNRAFYK